MFRSVMADTESGAPGGECKEPWKNICYEIKEGNKVIGSKDGVLHVKL